LDPGPTVEVSITDGAVMLPGLLTIPEGAPGVVLFAHGSGSSYRSARNGRVATRLNEEGLATLLFDLLSPLEAADRSNVFDADLLGGRLRLATAWIDGRPGEPLEVGYFGASTGAAAALVAAAELGDRIAAVVSRGGRPDLASAHLSEVRSPTLLIVGGLDTVVIELNLEAAARLRCPHATEIVSGATHLFEEPGALEQVMDLAAGWFSTYLRR
jgi:putative phosphoribosyl transferase